MVLEKTKQPLRLQEIPQAEPGPGQILIRVSACAVCRTDLHVMDGELPRAKLPLVPGHQIVGRVFKTGSGVREFREGTRVGVPWLASSCESCAYCRSGLENLCPEARYTGYQIDGGFAEFCIADQRFVFNVPEDYPDLEAAPLLCAGVIGYRAYRMAGEAKRLGFYGFGASAHILIQVALYDHRRVYAFTRPGDGESQAFARRLGAAWAGGSDENPPEALDAALIFAPVGALVPAALKSVRKGGTVVCAGIHMSDIPSFPYALLWEERVLRSVANLTRRDAREFLARAPRIPVRTEVRPYALEQANEALSDLREGRLTGSAVLLVNPQGA
jgi:propanol-preferring alcohol dehydrogenase